MSAALREVLDGAGVAAEVAGDAGVVVASVVQDSTAVAPGALFCCIAGSHVDGHAFARQAVEAGAAAVLAEHAVDVPDGATVVTVPSVREAIGPIASSFHGHPSRRLTLVGVTGTNGKTTTTHLLRSVFQANGQEAAVIGTLTSSAGSPPTTPDAPVLQARLAELVAAGTTAVAMEVSSHGLAMHRVDGTRFAAAAFTNLSQDHLDLHGTMEAYFAAKARLFTPAFTDLAVVGVDDPRGRLLVDAATVRTVPWSMADAGDLELTPEGSTFTWRGATVHVPLAGRVNVLNALCAATVAGELGIEPAVVAAGLAAAPGVRGRFEAVRGDQPFAVVVDYAHTPDGLENVLSSARELVGGGRKVIAVFGAGGDRDPAKRPRMGEVVSRLADLAVVTSDNPRSEDPGAIVDQIVAGMDGPAERVVEPDRRAAIGRAFDAAGPGDLVVLAGKGHETTQTIGDRELPFDDVVVARELLLERGFPTGEAR
jgi:UDP-N-acetylmuramoyl-L-alanyl-D-glutamate--2,6-diaminopimelate ligase